MRAKVILSATLLALLILAPTLYLRFHLAAPEQPAPPEVSMATNTETAVAPVPPGHHWSPPPSAAEGVPASRDEAADLSATNHEDYVIERRGQLAELGSSDDPAALKTILSELNNADPEIRKAALSATVQFGSQDAIPMLRNELSWAEDPREKVEIQNAIDFLQLPSASDTLTNDNGSITQQPGDAPAPGNN